MATRNELEGLPEELGGGLRPAHQRRADLLHDRGPGRRHARVRRATDGRRGADAAARRRRGTRAGADPARTACSARRTARSMRRSTRAATCGPSRLRRAAARGARWSKGRRRATIEADGSRITRVLTDIGPISAGTVVLAAGAWSPYLGRPARARAPDPPDAPPDRPDRADGPAPRRRPVRAGGGQAVRDLPGARSFRAGAVRDGARGPARPGPPRIGLPDRRRVVPAGHRHGLPGLRLEAGPRRRRRSSRRGWPPRCQNCAPPGSRVPGPASCRSPRTACRSSTVPPGFDDLIIAAGHVFGNGAGPTTGRLVADLICGTEPVIDMTPFRAGPRRASSRLPTGASGSDGGHRGASDRVHQPVRDGGLRRDHRGDPRAVRGDGHRGRRHPPRGRARRTSTTTTRCTSCRWRSSTRCAGSRSAGYDAVVVGCCYDPGVRVARELVDIPVVGSARGGDEPRFVLRALVHGRDGPSPRRGRGWRTSSGSTAPATAAASAASTGT